jgi:hypothetical protein
LKHTNTRRIGLRGLRGLSAAALLPITATVSLVSLAPTARAATSQAAPPPGLSVTISDATAQTASKATLTYTSTLTNAGTRPVTAQLVLAIPSYASYAQATGATVNKQTATWPVTVAAGKAVTKRAAVTIGTIPKGEVRVTTLISVYLPGHPPTLLIRSAEANRIQGVTDPAHSVNTVGANGGGNRPISPGTITTIVILGLVVLLLVGAWLARVRRRHEGDSSDGDRSGSRSGLATATAAANSTASSAARFPGPG